VLHAIVGYSGTQYWRLNFGLLEVKLDSSLPTAEQARTRSLIELLLWSRVKEERTANTKYPLAATPEGMHAEYATIQMELLGVGVSDVKGRDALPGVTWTGVISAMLSGQVRVGPAPQVN
jgi:hypothetical protein